MEKSSVSVQTTALSLHVENSKHCYGRIKSGTRCLRPIRPTKTAQQREGGEHCTIWPCFLIESKLPNKLWNYAIQTAAYVRNRCYSRHTKKTPYELYNGRVPNVSKLHKFGSVCFAYKQEKGKLNSRCEQGVFIGYDKNIPAYLVYYPDTERVQKHRLVKFPTKAATERETQTPESHIECDREVHPKVNMEENVDECVENVPEMY